MRGAKGEEAQMGAVHYPGIHIVDAGYPIAQISRCAREPSAAAADVEQRRGIAHRAA